MPDMNKELKGEAESQALLIRAQKHLDEAAGPVHDHINPS